MNIKIRVKQVYGNDTIYPACDTAIKFVTLLGRKTLTTKDISGIKSLGYQVEQVI